MPNNPGNSRDDSSQRNQAGAGSQDNMKGKNTGASQGQTSGQSNASQSSSQKQSQDSSKGAQGSSRGVSGGASSQNLRLQLTPEQQAQIRKATGRDASSLELSVEDIEDSLGESGSSDQSSSGQSSRDDSSSHGSMDSELDDEPSGRGNSEF